MTREERQVFNDWLKEHEGWVVAYCLGGLFLLFFGGILADVFNSVLFFGLVAGFAFTWPLLLLALNGAVLVIRRRSNESLRFERKMAMLDERERRISALERSTRESHYG